MGYFSIYKAVEFAVDSVRKNKDLTATQKDETIKLLKNLSKRDYFIKWDKEKIITVLKDYKERTGLTPTVTTLSEPGMPKGITIQSFFHVKPSLFLKQLFPENRKTRPDKMYTNVYGFNCDEAWLNCFREQFKKTGCTSAKAYNSLRDKDTPTWDTIARYLKIDGWKALMEYAGVEYPRKKIVNVEHPIIYDGFSPIVTKLEALNLEREKLNKELLDIYNVKKAKRRTK